MSDRLAVQERTVVRAERLVAGGAALARRDDGRVVLVHGALPGETVQVAITTRRGAAHGEVLRMLAPAPERVEPRCPHARAGCGGCDLAALGHPAQLGAKVALVADALRRAGRWADPEVMPGPSLDPWGFRTTLRVAVLDGRPALRRTRSHDLVVLDHCLVVHPRLDELLVEGSFGGASEVVLRVGAATGERLALVSPTRADVRLPDDVRVIGLDELASGRRAWIHEEVAGRRWRVSAGSFFQTRPDGAAALVDVVRELSGDVLDLGPTPDGAPRTLVDAYGGVGLFAGSLLGAGPGWHALLVEQNPSSAADARVNLRHLDAKVVTTTVERLRAPRADLVVADPSRTGLGRRAAQVLARTGASRIVLVSCDPASAGRDIGLLTALGYRAMVSVVVDMFPHAHHTEVVTRFDRESRP
jgi:23S rRNA (uracil1939-C5)-methyltransferase